MHDRLIIVVVILLIVLKTMSIMYIKNKYYNFIMFFEHKKKVKKETETNKT